MSKRSHHQRGFTLIASLLLLVLLSGLAIGLMYMVNGSQVIGKNDLANNVTYYAATSGMEQLTVSLANLYESNENPTQGDLDSMATSSAEASGSLMTGNTFYESASWTNGSPTPSSSLITEGQDAGLTALLVPVTLNVTATGPGGASVSMTRGVDMAFIPVFQFGVFSQSDLSYFAGPPFMFAGRVHTNGNLFLAADSGPLIFGSKVTAVGQIIRDQLANGHMNTSDHVGPVYVPNQTSGCDSYIAAKGTGSVPSHCIDVGFAHDNTGKTTNDASWSGGYPTGGSANSNWPSISTGSFNSFLGNQTSIGVQPMQLPFVTSNGTWTVNQNEIVREPETTTESTTSPLGASREYNKANIRILLADSESGLHPDGSADDSNDVQLYNTAAKTPVGITLNSTAYGAGKVSYFAVASNNASFAGPTGSGTSSKPYVYTMTITDPVWDTLNMSASPTATPFWPFCGASLPGDGTCTAITGTTQWPLVSGWLRVEYYGTDGAWHGVTNEWLSYGFIKDPYIARTTPGADTTGQKDAILILQQLADRDGNGVNNKTFTTTSATQKFGTKYYQFVTSYTESTATTGAATTATNFYPINFYDAREGFPRDSSSLSGTNGYTEGLMNAVELDVGNLQAWLKGTGDYSSGSGTLVNATPENGYLLYFSDRRGMEPDPNAIDPNTGSALPNTLNGESGLEDVINSSSGTGMPDGALDPKINYYTPIQSPEDVDDNGLLDNWGAADIGWGFDVGHNSISNTNEFLSVDLMNGGRQNKVTGARHVLKLVDGGITYLPMPGFTVASENPVYVQGNYNSDSADTVWTSPYNDDGRGHSAAAIIADAVTLLSNSWSDLNSMKNPSNLAGRVPTNTYYRMAIAAGKNMNFPVANVSYNPTSEVDFGTDGGLHNFLRFLETWGGETVSYRGSLVSLFYSQYATGAFKCCSLVYGAPSRNFYFDTDFLDPTKLPPGTPQLEDVVNLSYRQSFTPCTTQNGANCTN
jgi:type II secretory pathway pseudopilin PulG